MKKEAQSFQLHPRLEADSLFIADLAICQARLNNDSRFPWVLLMPRKPDLRELHELDIAEQQGVIAEITLASRTIQELFHSDKINVGAIGNMVPQLHIHIIGRKTTDPVWPNPVWGQGVKTPYDEKTAIEIIRTLKQAFLTPQSS